MELYAKGQLSYLILNCLLERDFYGLDIITEIHAKSGGKVSLKKPSVYSNLTRMEKQGYVSSYIKNSDLGPNRKYYSITDSGRDFFREIEAYFSRNNIDVFAQFDNENIEQENLFSENPAPVSQVAESEKLEEIQDNEFFDFSSVDESFTISHEEEFETDKQETQSLEEIENHDQDSTQIFSTTPYNENASQQSTTPKEDYAYSIKDALLSKNATEEKKDDGVFLDRQEVASYNQRLYDISKDINRYKKKKSFAEDQISITAEAPLLSSSIEKRKANLEDFKNSLIQNKKENAPDNDVFSRFASYRGKSHSFMEQEYSKTQEIEQVEKPDDGKFIFDHVDEKTIEKPRKIQPPRLNVLPESGKEKLPAPKRDSSIDPSHQEILSRLYSKTKGSSSQQRDDNLYDYNDLKDFYQNQNVAFDVYQKPTTKSTHNTNKLYFISSLITFLSATLSSVILYIILSSTSMLNTRFDFLYILLPALMVVDVVYQGYNMKKYKGWLPRQILPQWQIWTITGALICLCMGVNFAFGMAVNEFSLYATTLLLPLLMILILCPLRYYIKRYLIVKKWR